MDPSLGINDHHRFSGGVKRHLQHPERLAELGDKRGIRGRDRAVHNADNPYSPSVKGLNVAAKDQAPSSCFSATM